MVDARSITRDVVKVWLCKGRRRWKICRCFWGLSFCTLWKVGAFENSLHCERLAGILQQELLSEPMIICNNTKNAKSNIVHQSIRLQTQQPTMLKIHPGIIGNNWFMWVHIPYFSTLWKPFSMLLYLYWLNFFALICIGVPNSNTLSQFETGNSLKIEVGIWSKLEREHIIALDPSPRGELFRDV